MDYYKRKEVSNSDLSWLEQQLYPRELPDPTEAYKFGSLFDAMITENHTVDYYNFMVNDVKYKREDFKLAEKMKVAFFQDKLATYMASVSEGQVEMFRNMLFEYLGIQFNLDVRCKWDFWAKILKHGGDLKSTVATSQTEFEAVAKYFSYDRQRSWYMDIAGADKDILIGVSKKNFKVFKIFINRGDDFYLSGRDKYLELAFRWHNLYGNGRP